MRTYTTATMSVVANTDSKYAHFAAKTRLALVRAAVTQAINENKGVARFGLVKTRQAAATMPNVANAIVTNLDAAQVPAETLLGWNATVGSVTTDNGLQLAQLPVVYTDAAGSNSSIL